MGPLVLDTHDQVPGRRHERLMRRILLLSYRITHGRRAWLMRYEQAVFQLMIQDVGRQGGDGVKQERSHRPRKEV